MAPSRPEYQASFLEKLDIIPALVALMGAGIYAACAAPFRGEWGADTFKHHVVYSIVRKLVTRLNTAQLQYIGPPFHDTYKKWCASNGLIPNITTLPSGCKGFWVGDPSLAKYVCIYFHGGGFSLDGDPTHIQFWHSTQTEPSISCAFFFVEYSLVPHATFPVQLQQGVDALAHVLNNMDRSPSSVLVAGDSAGGNLTLAVLSHLLHPSPYCPAIDTSEPLKGLILVAPWVSFRTDWPSMERNKYKDIISSAAGAKWGQDYLNRRQTDSYVEAIEAPAGWWKDASSKAEHVLCVAGADEMLVDAISTWVDTYKAAGNDNITYLTAKNEAHIAPIFELQLGNTNETEQGKAILSWMKAKL